MNEMQKLLEILRDVNEDVDFENETALVDEGYIDYIHIEVGDIEPENFNSAEAILATVKCYQEAK